MPRGCKSVGTALLDTALGPMDQPKQALKQIRVPPTCSTPRFNRHTPSTEMAKWSYYLDNFWILPVSTSGRHAPTSKEMLGKTSQVSWHIRLYQKILLNLQTNKQAKGCLLRLRRYLLGSAFDYATEVVRQVGLAHSYLPSEV